MVNFTGGGKAPSARTGSFGGMLGAAKQPAYSQPPAPASGGAGIGGGQGGSANPNWGYDGLGGYGAAPTQMWRSNGLKGAGRVAGFQPFGQQATPQMSEPLPPAAAAVGAGTPQMSDVLPMAPPEPVAPVAPVEPPQTANPFWLAGQQPVNENIGYPVRLGYFGGMV